MGREAERWWRRERGRGVVRRWGREVRFGGCVEDCALELEDTVLGEVETWATKEGYSDVQMRKANIKLIYDDH